MPRDITRSHMAYFSKEKASSIRPILKWIKEGAPRKREREQAAKILKEIEGIKDWKQVQLTRGEAELLNFITEEFPDGAGESGRQLSLFSLFKEPEEVRIVVPPIPKKERPVLKTDLSEEEQAERDSSLEAGRYEPLPASHWERKLRSKE